MEDETTYIEGNEILLWLLSLTQLRMRHELSKGKPIESFLTASDVTQRKAAQLMIDYPNLTLSESFSGVLGFHLNEIIDNKIPKDVYRTIE